MFKTITSVEEARALCKARLLWWDKTEPAALWWASEGKAEQLLKEHVAGGLFSILLED